MRLGFVDSKNFEVFTIDNMDNTDWWKPIVDYLENPIGLTDRKVKYRSLSYVLIGNKLFKKALEGILIKFLCESETYLGVQNVHSGACGAHWDGHKMKWLLIRQGVYWPMKNLLKDIRNVKCMWVSIMPLQVSYML